MASSLWHTVQALPLLFLLWVGLALPLPHAGAAATTKGPTLVGQTFNNDAPPRHRHRSSYVSHYHYLPRFVQQSNAAPSSKAAVDTLDDVDSLIVVASSRNSDIVHGVDPRVSVVDDYVNDVLYTYRNDSVVYTDDDGEDDNQFQNANSTVEADSVVADSVPVVGDDDTEWTVVDDDAFVDDDGASGNDNGSTGLWTVVNDDIVVDLNGTVSADNSLDSYEDYCSADGELVIGDGFHNANSSTTCAYCENYHVWQAIPIPSNLTSANATPDAIVAYQQAVWDRMFATTAAAGENVNGDSNAAPARAFLPMDLPLYNYSCINGCTTCFSRTKDVGENDDENDHDDTFCGTIESKQHLVMNPLVRPLSTADVNGTTTDEYDNFLDSDNPWPFTFSLSSEICFSYDTETVAETGRACLGFSSAENQTDSTGTSSTTTATLNSACYIEYNSIRCNKCTVVVDGAKGADAAATAAPTPPCLVADCSNLDVFANVLGASGAGGGSTSALMDTCSESSSFVGPLRFVQIWNWSNGSMSVGTCRASSPSSPPPPPAPEPSFTPPDNDDDSTVVDGTSGTIGRVVGFAEWTAVSGYYGTGFLSLWLVAAGIFG